MNALIPLARAAAAAPVSSGSQLAPLLVMGGFIVVFYFLLIRPQQKKAKEHQTLISKLAPGDEVVTSGGLLGRITEVGEHFVTLEVAENVRVKVQRGQINTLMPKGTLKGA
ncbi:YajC [mine drainage metagenome]|jgi:preprotein translocase subunit YajC|uniref:YajC n=1 Tax=mine drainage metagenome TaxID=410659 RepID=T1CBM8_9ZZZZ